MPARRDEWFERVSQWIRFAEEDLQAARQPNVPARIAAFHAQQCAEKALKAYLIHQRADFPFTHNISLLLELCEDHGRWPLALAESARLTSFAVSARYPGANTEVTSSQATMAVNLATTVITAVRAELARDGFTLHE